MSPAASKTAVPRQTSSRQTAPRQSSPPSIVGWNGIYLELPPEWDLRQVSGDMGQGHLRIDGPDGMHIRVKWRKQRKSVDLKRVLERYLASLEKGAKRSKTVFDSSTDLRLKMPGDAKRKPLFFTWKGAEQAVGMIWHCGICDRVTIAQVDGPLKKNLTGLATTILGTLDDHEAEGYLTWGVYGLSAEVPATFTLLKSKLLSGYIHLEFGRGASGIDLDRWGLAEVLLRKESLEKWVVSQYGKILRKYRYTVSEVEVRGHKGLLLTGDLRGIRERMKAAAMDLARMKPVMAITHFVWHCEDTNRICSVLVQHAREETDLAGEIAASYVCHS